MGIFNALLTILVLIIVIIIASVAGYYVYKQNKISGDGMTEKVYPDRSHPIGGRHFDVDSQLDQVLDKKIKEAIKQKSNYSFDEANTKEYEELRRAFRKLGSSVAETYDKTPKPQLVIKEYNPLGDMALLKCSVSPLCLSIENSVFCILPYHILRFQKNGKYVATFSNRILRGTTDTGNYQERTKHVTYRHTRKDGGRDLRYNYNPKDRVYYTTRSFNRKMLAIDIAEYRLKYDVEESLRNEAVKTIDNYSSAIPAMNQKAETIARQKQTAQQQNKPQETATPAAPAVDAENASNWDWFFRSAEERRKAIERSGRAADSASARKTQDERKTSENRDPAPINPKRQWNVSERRMPTLNSVSTLGVEMASSCPPGWTGSKIMEPKPYSFPSLQLLRPVKAIESSEQPDKVSEQLEKLFRKSRVSLTISDYCVGPSITWYKAKVEPGTSLNKMPEREEDIALMLGRSRGVRIAPVPNEACTIGIEIPNETRGIVSLREILESEAFQKAESKLSFALGKGADGEIKLGDLSRLRHLLITGMPDSGKSTFLNDMILSLMYKASPEDVRIILIDPMMVELKHYNGIPHLISPVITSCQRADGALQWAEVEMMIRYRLFSEENSKDIVSYNATKESESKVRKESFKPLPRIVVIIDELAALMNAAGKSVEDSIDRISKMGHSAGIHLVIATQSTQSELLTKRIRDDLPARCIFRMQNGKYLKQMLGNIGAENLLGDGDMLFTEGERNGSMRIQSAFVSDEEMDSVIEYVKNGVTYDIYDDEIITEMDRLAGIIDYIESVNEPVRNDDDLFADYDELLPECVDVALESGQVSVSMLQRRVKLGYSRAARIVDQMEELGVIGPYEGARPRQVLITRAEWQEMQMSYGASQDEFLP